MNEFIFDLLLGFLLCALRTARKRRFILISSFTKKLSDENQYDTIPPPRMLSRKGVWGEPLFGSKERFPHMNYKTVSMPIFWGFMPQDS